MESPVETFVAALRCAPDANAAWCFFVAESTKAASGALLVRSLPIVHYMLLLVHQHLPALSGDDDRTTMSTRVQAAVELFSNSSAVPMDEIDDHSSAPSASVPVNCDRERVLLAILDSSSDVIGRGGQLVRVTARSAVDTIRSARCRGIALMMRPCMRRCA